jgi:hypothetical protein
MPVKKRSKIKKTKEGSFTAWAKSHGYSMSKAIEMGLKSTNPAIRKKANFARNARKWKHAGKKKR